jgi:hypothetical protein
LLCNHAALSSGLLHLIGEAAAIKVSPQLQPFVRISFTSESSNSWLTGLFITNVVSFTGGGGGGIISVNGVLLHATVSNTHNDAPAIIAGRKIPFIM